MKTENSQTHCRSTQIRQNPVSYPLYMYVSRIMKILARGQQNQTETFEDNQCTIEELMQTRFDELRTESASWVRIYRCINNLIFMWSHDCAWFKAEIDQSKIVAKSTRYLRDSQDTIFMW